MIERIREALRRRYHWPKYVLVEELANGTGAHQGRRADAVALAVWPSSGMWLYGFEVKTQRSDLLRELKNPTKWRGVGRYCDYWWIVVTDDVVKKADDIPAAWGILTFIPKSEDGWPTVDTFAVSRRPRRQESEPLDRPFIAALLRQGVRVSHE